jgi:hypothetical protein
VSVAHEQTSTNVVRRAGARVAARPGNGSDESLRASTLANTPYKIELHTQGQSKPCNADYTANRAENKTGERLTTAGGVLAHSSFVWSLP